MKQSADLTTPDLFGTEIRRVDINGEPWFAAQDVCKALDLGNITWAMRALDDDEKDLSNTKTLGGMQKLNVVSISGLFHLTFVSRKPVAQAFRRWVTGVLLPALLKQGFYGDPMAKMRTRDYLEQRGIDNCPDGFGHTVMAVCRRRGIRPQLHRKRGHSFPLIALEEAAMGKSAKRGPLLPGSTPDVFVFIRDRVQ